MPKPRLNIQAGLSTSITYGIGQYRNLSLIADYCASACLIFLAFCPRCGKFARIITLSYVAFLCLCYPIQIAANQQFVFLVVVRGFHGNFTHVKAVLFGQLANFRCIVIGHQEIARQFSGLGK